MFEKANLLSKYGIKTPYLQELIWFHRIKDDQDKELLLLEFFNVCSNHNKIDKLFDKEYRKVSYNRDLYLRNLLYNFPELDNIYKKSNNDSEKWEKTFSTLSENNSNDYNSYDYSYLKSRFENFDTFFSTIEILRKASLGLNTSRRWTSKFLFPVAYNSFFPDIDNKKGNSMDRRFFSRGGEVLYLMVSRAKNSDKLKLLLQKSFFDPEKNKRWSNLINVLRKEENIDYDIKEVELGFLGRNESFVFDNLVDDFISLLETNIPQNDLFYHLASIASFYIVHYILSVSYEILEDSLVKNNLNKVIYPVEILAPKSDQVRKASREIYKINEDITLRTLNKTLDDYFNSLSDIQNKDDLTEKLKLDINYTDEIKEEFNLEYIKEFISEKILDKAKSELNPIHRVLLKGAGLASPRKTTSYRYLINDDFLKTLVITNIEYKMTFDNFLDLLYIKYGFIISEKHSEELVKNYSKNDFKKNSKRFFERLRALGLLINKSDGYAYVINRYGRK